MIVSIRGVDEKLFKKFKEEAVKEDVPLGEAANLAFRHWVDDIRAKRRPKKSLKDLKPWDWGPGTERTSEEIDEILYGGKIGK